MKSMNIAKIFISLAIIAQLIVMSGWFAEKVINILQIASLILLLLTLFVLRKKKRKTKRSPKQKQPKEVASLLEKANEE